MSKLNLICDDDGGGGGGGDDARNGTLAPSIYGHNPIKLMRLIESVKHSRRWRHLFNCGFLRTRTRTRNMEHGTRGKPAGKWKVLPTIGKLIDKLLQPRERPGARDQRGAINRSLKCCSWVGARHGFSGAFATRSLCHVACHKIINTLIELLTDAQTHTLAGTHAGTHTLAGDRGEIAGHAPCECGSPLLGRAGGGGRGGGTPLSWWECVCFHGSLRSWHAMASSSIKALEKIVIEFKNSKKYY